MRGFFYDSGVFVAEGVDGVGDVELGDTTRVDIHTLAEIFENVLWACLFH
jgi:hypothetical protein